MTKFTTWSHHVVTQKDLDLKVFGIWIFNFLWSLGNFKHYIFKHYIYIAKQFLDGYDIKNDIHFITRRFRLMVELVLSSSFHKARLFQLIKLNYKPTVSFSQTVLKHEWAPAIAPAAFGRAICVVHSKAFKGQNKGVLGGR